MAVCDDGHGPGWWRSVWLPLHVTAAGLLTFTLSISTEVHNGEERERVRTKFLFTYHFKSVHIYMKWIKSSVSVLK